VASRADPVAVGPAGAAPAVTSAPLPEIPTPLPSAPSIGGAFRAAARNPDIHTWRLLPANVVWAAMAIGLAIGVLVVPAAILLLPVLALPTAGIFRVTTRIARGQSVSFWDSVDAWRTDVGRTIVFGGGLVAATAVLGVNVVSGLESASAIGWALATLAAWGLVATWLMAWVGWPLIVDPERIDQSFADRLRLAALLILAHPLRIGALGVVLAVFLALSTIAIVALVTISVAFAALVASQFVLPAADRLEARLDARPGARLARPSS
jgi:uncharacterized membrane protein YesL